MKKTLVSLLVICHVAMSLCAQQKAASAQKTLAITHVAVIDTSGGALKLDMTVIIVGGRIAAIGKSRTVKIPKGVQLVNAAGKFLIPGLWDMHVHIGNDDFDKNSYLRLFIANGVTGIRIMNGRPPLPLRGPKFGSVPCLGQQLVTPGPSIIGRISSVAGRCRLNKRN